MMDAPIAMLRCQDKDKKTCFVTTATLCWRVSMEFDELIILREASSFYLAPMLSRFSSITFSEKENEKKRFNEQSMGA